MSETQRREPPLARLVGRRPNRGAAGAAKEVVADVQQLVRAELDLAKAEIAEGVKSKVMGAGFFIGAAIIGWLAIQAFLVFLGFVFATFLPGWAASGLVLLLLLIAIAVLGFLGYRKLQADASRTISKASIEQSKQVTSAAVEQAKANTREGVEEAKATLSEAANEVKARIDHRRGKPSTGLGAGSEPTALGEPPALGNPTARREPTALPEPTDERTAEATQS